MREEADDETELIYITGNPSFPIQMPSLRNVDFCFGPNKYKWRGNFFNFVFDLKNQ